MPRAKLSDVEPIDEPQSGRAKLSDAQPVPVAPPFPGDNAIQRYIDTTLSAPPQDSGWRGDVERVGQRAAAGLIAPAVHPLNTATGMLRSTPPGMLLDLMRGKKPVPEEAGEQYGKDIAANPRAGLENIAGDVLGAGLQGGLISGVPLLRNAGTAVREAALGDSNAAALRGLKVAPSSPKGLRTVGAVEGARPFLKGAQSLEDLQSRIGPAKEEIWSPYKQAIDVVGKRPVRGPDGVTTIGELEQERLQLSALNRGLKERNPEAIRLAEQKGLSQADLLKRENQVKASLDPALQDAGINPSDIRQAFGQVSEIGNRISGKTTLAEKPQPTGIGRMLNMKLENPRTWIGEPVQGARDIIAGRPLWSAKPTDLNIREAFRAGGEKPDFGAVRPLTNKLLPSSASTPEGEEPVGPWEYGIPNESTITPAPRSYPALTSQAGPGEAQPMIWEKGTPSPDFASDFARQRVVPPVSRLGRTLAPETQGLQLPSGERPLLPENASPERTFDFIGGRGDAYPSLNESTARTRVSPPQFLSPGEPLPPSLRIANPPLPEGAEGPTLAPRLAPRGLLPGGFTSPPVPESSSVEIYPPGSTLRGAPVEGTQMYPSASQFHAKIPAFKLEEYLRNNP